VLDRRQFLTRLLAGVGAFLSLGGYAFAVEPRLRLEIARQTIRPRQWPASAKPLTVALLSDFHASDPWMGVGRLEEIVARANGLGADMILLLGDYSGGILGRRWMQPAEWARPLGQLRAPLGVHAILGNHDYFYRSAGRRVTEALREVGIDVLLNEARHIRADGHDFWLAGTESAFAWNPEAGERAEYADLDATFARIDGDRPVVLMAHEPVQFIDVPERVALTVSGHTHGGQIGLPFLAALHHGTGRGWVRGHYEEAGRHLFVTSGLGMSFLPVRFMVPPEIALIRLEPPTIA
jgi:hypothetical protein